MQQNATLFEIATSIQNQMATLKMGLPMAIAKASTPMQRVKICQRYKMRIKELSEQYKSVYAAMYEAYATEEILS